MVGELAFGLNSMLGAQCANFTEMFGNRYRYSGVALARELGAVLSGGVFWVMGPYMAVLCILTLTETFLSVETRERDLTLLNDAVGKAAKSRTSSRCMMPGVFQRDQASHSCQSSCRRWRMSRARPVCRR
jgi:hypothetical protein